MDQRRALVVVVRTFALLAIVGFSIPFLGTLFTSAVDDTATRVIVDIAAIKPGRPHFIELTPTRPLIVMRPGQQQRQELAALTQHVWGPSLDDDADGLYVHWGLSTGKFGGCRLAHQPATSAATEASRSGSTWKGGYWAAGCDASYDYAGRAIKTRRYAFGGYVEQTRALRSPRYEILDGGKLAVMIESP